MAKVKSRDREFFFPLFKRILDFSYTISLFLSYIILAILSGDVNA